MASGYLPEMSQPRVFRGVLLSSWPFPPPTSLHGPGGTQRCKQLGVASKRFPTRLKRENKKAAQIMATMPASKVSRKVASVTNVNPEKDRCSLEGLEGFQKLKILSETGLFFEDGFKTLSSPP